MTECYRLTVGVPVYLRSAVAYLASLAASRGNSLVAVAVAAAESGHG
jgi:hypothetical protein